MVKIIKNNDIAVQKPVVTIMKLHIKSCGILANDDKKEIGVSHTHWQDELVQNNLTVFIYEQVLWLTQVYSSWHGT